MSSRKSLCLLFGLVIVAVNQNTAYAVINYSSNEIRLPAGKRYQITISIGPETLVAESFKPQVSTTQQREARYMLVPTSPPGSKLPLQPQKLVVPSTQPQALYPSNTIVRQVNRYPKVSFEQLPKSRSVLIPKIREVLKSSLRRTRQHKPSPIVTKNPYHCLIHHPNKCNCLRLFNPILN